MAAASVSSNSGQRNSNWRGGFASGCTQCGARVWVKPSRASRDRHFCGKPCANRWMSENTRGASGSQWRGGEVEHACKACAKPFRALPSKRRLYCSRLCDAAARLATRPAVSCGQCGVGFSVQRYRAGSAKFCSGACLTASLSAAYTPEQRRIDGRMFTEVWFALRRNRAGLSWEKRVGYTLAELVAHLEKMFAPRMSWANAGKWQIDHRKPRSTFTYSSFEDVAFKECWSLSNLQPLWASDNARKGARHTIEMSPPPG